MTERFGTFNGKKFLYFHPTRQDIENLKVGDLAPDAFGNLKEVVWISARKEDVNGKLFVNYATKFGDDKSSMTNSMKEDRVERTMRLCNILNSADIDTFEDSCNFRRKHLESV